MQKRKRGKLTSSKLDLLYNFAAGHSLSKEYDLHHMYFVTLNLKSVNEETSNALKVIKKHITPLLNGAPFIWIGVRVLSSPIKNLKQVHAHLHFIVFLPIGAEKCFDDIAAEYLNMSRSRTKNAIRPFHTTAVYDAFGLLNYLRGRENLGRHGATLIRSQVVIEFMAKGVFQKVRDSQGTLDLMRLVEEKRREKFTPISTALTSSKVSLLTTHSSLPKDVVFDHTIGEIINNNEQPSNADNRDDPSFEDATPITVATDLINKITISPADLVSLKKGLLSEGIKQIVLRTLDMRQQQTSDQLAWFVGISQGQLENILHGHRNANEAVCLKLHQWLINDPILKPIGRKSNQTKGRTNDNGAAPLSQDGLFDLLAIAA